MPSSTDADRMREAVAGLAAAAQGLAEIIAQQAHPLREVVFSAPTQRPRVLGLDEAGLGLLLANALAVLEHARTRIHSSRRAQLDGVANDIRTALQRPKKGGAPGYGPPDQGSTAAAA